MNFLSLFSGIGAFEKALDRLGIKYNLVNYCEIDKQDSKSYAAVHNVSEDLNLGDITQVDTSKLPHIDMISYGFPCQDISLAGKQKGLFNEDGTHTRSGLFFEALRIIEDTQPKVAIAENVKSLVSKKFNAQFQIVLESLEQAGYNNYWQVLNAKDYGIPQNRERVFIVSIRKDIDTGCFKFPEPFELELRLKDLLESEVDEKFYLSGKYDSITAVNNEYVMLNGGVIGKMHDISRRAYSDNSVSPTIPTCGGGNTEPKVIIREATKKGYAEAYEGDSVNLEQPNSKTRRGRVGKQVAQTLTTSPAQGVVTAAAMRGRYNENGQAEQQIEISDRDYANAITTVQKDSLISFVNGDVCKTVRTGGHGSTDRHSWDMVECNTSLRIRKLTPLECWRLQGFDDDDDFYKAEKVCSNTQLYKQAGNSIVVDVLEYLFKELMEVLALGKVFNVTPSCICNLIKGRSWGGV